MLSVLIVSVVLSQVPPPSISRPANSTPTAGHDTVIRKRREAEARKRYARVNRALNERYEAQQRLLEAERLAPIIAQQQTANANALYQAQAGNALDNIGIAARQNAFTNRLRVVNQFGPGYLPALNAPALITPTDVIRAQTGQ